MADLDAYARGEHALSNDTEVTMQRGIQSLMSHRQGDFSKLQPYCPDKIAEFRAAVVW
jgi:hypothetical protein